MRAVVFALVVFSPIGCAPPPSPSGPAPTSATWKIGDFHVHFQAGPRGQEGRAYSYYEIKYSQKGGQERSLVMESAHTLEGFGCVTNGDPKNWIRMIEDPNRKALLIEEEIPNDCGPCSNFLLVQVDASGGVNGSYLQLPLKAKGPQGGIDSEYPRVRALHGRFLKFDYSGGASVTQGVDEIDRSDSPTPPG